MKYGFTFILQSWLELNKKKKEKKRKKTTCQMHI